MSGPVNKDKSSTSWTVTSRIFWYIVSNVGTLSFARKMSLMNFLKSAQNGSETMEFWCTCTALPLSYCQFSRLFSDLSLFKVLAEITVAASVLSSTRFRWSDFPRWHSRSKKTAEPVIWSQHEIDHTSALLPLQVFQFRLWIFAALCRGLGGINF